MVNEKSIGGVPERAFKDADLKILGVEPIERKANLAGLKTPAGIILVFPNEYVSGAAAKTLKDALGAEYVGVKGKWVFVPDSEEN